MYMTNSEKMDTLLDYCMSRPHCDDCPFFSDDKAWCTKSVGTKFTGQALNRWCKQIGVDVESD